MKLIGYIRVSKEDRVGRAAKSGLGLEAQEAAIREFSKGKNLECVEVDSGLGGALPIEDRPGLRRAIELLDPGDTLVVAKRDRIARDIAVFVLVQKAVEARGARIVSTSGEGTADDEPESILMRMIFDSFAVYERLIIKKRTRLALAEKKRRGERVGRPRIEVADPERAARLSRKLSVRKLATALGVSRKVAERIKRESKKRKTRPDRPPTERFGDGNAT